MTQRHKKPECSSAEIEQWTVKVHEIKAGGIAEYGEYIGTVTGCEGNEVYRSKVCRRELDAEDFAAGYKSRQWSAAKGEEYRPALTKRLNNMKAAGDWLDIWSLILSPSNQVCRDIAADWQPDIAPALKAPIRDWRKFLAAVSGGQSETQIP